MIGIHSSSRSLHNVEPEGRNKNAKRTYCLKAGYELDMTLLTFNEIHTYAS